MIDKTVNKLWKEKFCSVRDYEVRKAIKNGGMILYHKNKRMVLDVEMLRALKPCGKIIHSQYKGTYQLVDILFEPEIGNFQQKNLF